MHEDIIALFILFTIVVWALSYTYNRFEEMSIKYNRFLDGVRRDGATRPFIQAERSLA